jgi:hypothetical protein
MFESHKVRGARRVSKKEALELSKLPWVADEALSDELNEARVLPDGRVLHFFRQEGGGNLYPSREALAELLQRVKESAAEGPFEPAKELLPPLDEFVRDVDKLASSLGKVLHIPDEALDRSVESLDLVDKALGRLRVAKRMTPEVFTAVTAYLGEVMRLVSDGRWARLPATIKKSRPVYDPVEYAAYATAQNAVVRAAGAAADKALADARARGAGDHAATDAYYEALHAPLAGSTVPQPKVLRYEEYEEPLTGHENEPVIRAHDGGPIFPVASVIRSLSERATYGTLRVAVEGHLAGYLSAKRKAAS